MDRIPTSVGIESDTLQKVDEKHLEFGYRSRSDLVNDLLKKWVQNPQRKEIK
jgi:metal-responsive CopG/Arc/MetJ family transcriptional regulator